MILTLAKTTLPVSTGNPIKSAPRSLLFSCRESLLPDPRIGTEFDGRHVIQYHLISAVLQLNFIGVPGACRKMLIIRVILLAGRIGNGIDFVNCPGPVEGNAEVLFCVSPRSSPSIWISSPVSSAPVAKLPSMLGLGCPLPKVSAYVKLFVRQNTESIKKIVMLLFVCL